MPPRSSDPATPKEAIDWFKKRLPITKDDWLELDELSQEKAFTIAGIAQLDLIAEVQKDIARALKNGESLEAFKKRVGPKLEEAWGEERGWHTEVVFRNAAQRAYQAGRRKQLVDPENLAVRPYLRAEVILDGRTTPDICRPIAGTTLPAEHPFWNTHWPPLHHNCRTTIRSLVASDAKKKGATKSAPRVDPADGFGSVDPLEWSPDLEGYPSKLVNIYRRGR